MGSPVAPGIDGTFLFLVAARQVTLGSHGPEGWRVSAGFYVFPSGECLVRIFFEPSNLYLFEFGWQNFCLDCDTHSRADLFLSFHSQVLADDSNQDKLRSVIAVFRPLRAYLGVLDTDLNSGFIFLPRFPCLIGFESGRYCQECRRKSF